MPGDPRECRKRAARCAELAVEAKPDQLKAHFLTLSKTWENLALELERTEQLLAEFEPKQNGHTTMPPASAELPNPPAPSQRR